MPYNILHNSLLTQLH
ncbi:activating signal cointegrator 1 complex subunit 3 (predicted), isoform CRA_d, partial [Rattus norvegicus]